MRTRRVVGSVMILLSTLILGACGGDGVATTAPGVQPTAGVTTTTTTTITTATTTATAGTAAAATGGGPATTPATAAPPAATARASATAATTGGATTARGTAAAPAAAAERYAIVPDRSKATYRVRETFIGQGLSTAVGTTNVISGDISINRQQSSASRIGTITVDISKLASDQSRRDLAIRNDWLESNTYPTATFVPKRLEGLPDTPYTEGQELTFKIVGDLTVRNVTKEVTFDATGKIVGDTFTGTATTQFNMTDFGFDPPDIAGFLRAENGVQLEMTIEAKRAP